MMKRILSALLALVLLASLSLTAFAEGSVSVEYYSIEMKQSFFNKYVLSSTVQLMIYPTKEEIYINAEDLNGLAGGYRFEYSESDCAFSSEERGHLVYYKYNAKKMIVYHSGEPVSYKMPYTAKYVDDVVWLPLDFAMKMLNIEYTISEDGAECCYPSETVFSVAHRILQGNLKFDYASELGYTDLSMFGLETGAFLANLFNGVLAGEGSCWGTLATSLVGNTDLYEGWLAEDVCDLFVMPAQNEFAKGAVDMYQFPLNLDKANTAREDYSKIYYDLIFVKNEARATGNKKLAKKIALLGGEVKEITKTTAAQSVLKETLTVENIGRLLELAALKLQYENRDMVAARALKLYGEKTSSNVSKTVKNYARDVNIQNDMLAATSRYFTENLDNILLDKIPIGPAAFILVGWNIASSHIPYVKESLNSTKNFSYSQLATAMQNDVFWILKNDYNEALSSKKLREGSLEDVASECYTYLKFTLIARECAIKSVKDAQKIDEGTKERTVANLEAKNERLAEMISVVACVKEGNYKGVNNETGAYQALLPSENSEYLRKLDDGPAISAVKDKLGTLIASATMEAQPEEEVLVTEEEAIQMVRDALDKYTLGLMNSEQFGGAYTYECLELCDAYIIDLGADGLLDDTAEFDTDYCYIIALYTSGRLDSLFCVPADGTGTYICAEYGDMDYAYLQEFNLSDLSIVDLVKVMKQFSGLVFQEMMDEYSQDTASTQEETLPDT